MSIILDSGDRAGSKHKGKKKESPRVAKGSGMKAETKKCPEASAEAAQVGGRALAVGKVFSGGFKLGLAIPDLVGVSGR